MVETTVKVTLPEMGESVTEGTIVEWRKRVGDWIDEGDTLVEVTTDKVDVEVPATASGVVTALLAEEGATINVGAALCEIDATATKPAAGSAPAASAAKPAAAAPTPTISPASVPPAAKPVPPSNSGPATAPPEKRPRVLANTLAFTISI